MAYELPLFPLNTVLFPGMPLTLHIFEERYKEMIGHCLQHEAAFGVVLIRRGVEAMGPAEPYLIGCTAEIVQVQQLLGGRMNILAMGKERFRILSLHEEHPFLTGMVVNFPLVADETQTAKRAGRRLQPWLKEYVTLLSEAGDVEFDTGKLPDEPYALAYLAAAVLQVPNTQKQELLATPDTAALLCDMRLLYRRELPLLRAMLRHGERVPSGPGSFSLS